MPSTMALPPRFATLPRNLAIVAGFNTAIAVGIVAAGRDSFGAAFVYSQCIGLLILLSIDLPRRFAWQDGVLPGRALLALSVAGVVAGFLGGSFIASLLLGRPLESGLFREGLPGAVTITLFAAAVSIGFFVTRERMAKLRLQAETVERGAAEARLKLLQAQIEPHFLFNTLANLHSLIGSDPARARAMLEHLNDYLRATLDAARRDAGTLGEEMALLRGYLEVIKVRMGSRLEFSLQFDEEIQNHPLPPMLLQPLVENAIKHGLEPKVDGGRVDISAKKNGDRIEITIADTGLGNPSTKGTGVGLAHVRERLAAAYGAKAFLSLEANESKGMTASVMIPAA